MSARSGSAGRSVLRFQQVYQGVRVLGGELAVNLDGSKNLLSIGGEALSSPDVSVAPRIESSVARDTALEAVAKARSVSASTLQASEPSLWIYDSRIMGGPGLGRPTLVWRMDVTGKGGPEPIDELVLVDALLGVVTLHFDQREHALNRQVCDANNTDSKLPCTAPFARVEGGAASAIADVNGAYDYAGATYDFYYDVLGRNSIDGAGMTITSTTRYCPTGYDCPFDNAWWDGEQMDYGQGFASADDVVGHELTHGVTQYTSRLFYYYQSGAINESLSDVFGEFIDLTDHLGNDSPAVRWELGEDLPASVGVGRDMKNPPLYGQPDKMSSPNYSTYTDESPYWDNGGVHTNSGINNKVAYLITDGDIFNGKTVTGIGITKAAKIYYEAETNLLTSASDYADLYSALQQACTDLVGSAGITSANCEQVTNAVNAVEMNVTPPAAPASEAPVCSTGQSPHDLFSDNLENTASGNWIRQLGSGLYQTWYYPQNPNDIDFDATYATSGTTNFWGYDQEFAADYSIAMTSSVAIPAGSTPYLCFNHAYMFENYGTTYAFDGGVLEYSTNGGASWADAGSLLTSNGYNGTISNLFDNPLKGRSAFVKESNGYISSRASLASLAGQSVRFRFRIGTDTDGSDYGWFVDDIRVYTCIPPTFAFSSATYSVGEAGPTASVTINRTGSTSGADSVHFATANGTATAGSDYTAVSQTVSFAAGETSKTVPVPITDDGLLESSETVSLSLSSPSAGATLGSPSTATLTIQDNDAALAFSSATYSVKESGGSATITVKRTGVISSAVSVGFATANGTAKAGLDYTAVSQTLSFASGVTSKTVAVPITNDKLLEGKETVALMLSSPSAGAGFGSPSTATLTIINNPGRIASAKLTKTSFKSSQARKVNLVVKFSPASRKFNYLLSFKKGAKWLTVRSVKKNGNFAGTRRMTVKSLFRKKTVKSGRYRLKLTADANSKALKFRVT
jgi:bacillolysin